MTRPIDRLIAIMARLRDPARGCPWDREQDFATIAPYTIEEAYEVADAIERGDMAALKDRITYTYVETPRGGRVDIVTRDRDAVGAVHRFLRFQIADHRTGDSTAVTPR